MTVQTLEQTKCEISPTFNSITFKYIGETIDSSLNDRFKVLESYESIGIAVLLQNSSSFITKYDIDGCCTKDLCFYDSVNGWLRMDIYYNPDMFEILNPFHLDDPFHPDEILDRDDIVLAVWDDANPTKEFILQER